MAWKAFCRLRNLFSPSECLLGTYGAKKVTELVLAYVESQNVSQVEFSEK